MAREPSSMLQGLSLLFFLSLFVHCKYANLFDDKNVLYNLYCYYFYTHFSTSFRQHKSTIVIIY